MFKNEPDLLTRKQCQDLLHISKSKMLDLIHKDLIPAHIIAGSLINMKRKFNFLPANLEIRIIKNSQKIPRHFIFLVSYKRIFLIFHTQKNLSAIDFPI